MHRYANAGVVALVVLIGGGLLFPAIGKVREAERTSKCQENLKQVGMALHYYHYCFEHLPAGTVANPDLAPGRRLSWLVETQPYGFTQIGFAIDREAAWDARQNYDLKAGGAGGPLFPQPDFPYFLCPSGPPKTAPHGPGLTHYVGVAGLGERAAELPLGYPEAGLVEKGAGVFGYDRTLKFPDIKDGMANTLAVVETAWENGPWTAGGYPTVRGLVPGRPYVGAGQQFGGVHPAGAMALFADGSVRLLADSMSPKAFEALATISGGEE